MERYKDPALSARERTADLLARMTTEEKIGQLHQPSLAEDPDALREDVRRGRAGALVLAYTPLASEEKQPGGLRREQRREIQRVAVEESRLGIPLLLGRDVVHGHRTVFPIPLAQAASWDPERVRAAAKTAAREAAADGVNWVFAPMMDVTHDPRWGRVIEGFGEDPILASRMARACVEGFQEGGLAACAKHYIGYGASEGGRDYNSVDIPDATLHSIYLPPFRAAVDAGVHTVMSSFNDVNGVPVTASHRLLTGLLKHTLKFRGFVVSDWDAVRQLVEQGAAGDEKEAAALAFLAGVDMDMGSGCFVRHLPALLREGAVSEERLDDAVGRVLWVKFRLGLFEHPYGPKAAEEEGAGALALARELARRSMVLLKNDGGLLPLSRAETTIAVVGPMAGERRAHLGSWTLDGREEAVASLAESLADAAPEATIVTATSSLYDDRLAAVRRADVVVAALGESWERTGEAHSVARLRLSPDQEALVADIARLGKPVVAVICAGRPLALGTLSQTASAILYAWHGGVQAGRAVADIVFGDFAPCGKMPLTVPRHVGQIPLYYNHRASGRKIDEYYADNQYFNYDDLPGSPLYPFGYGLSYTSFAIRVTGADKTQRAAEIRVRVTNTGSVAGRANIQLYVRRTVRGYACSVRQLLDFQTVELRAGQSQTVRFRVNREDCLLPIAGEESLDGWDDAAFFVGERCDVVESVQL